LTAQTASLFWTTEANPSILSVRTTPFDSAIDGAPPFRLDEFECNKTVLPQANGRELVLLRRSSVTVQLVVQGTSVLTGPVRAIFEIDGLTHAGKAIVALHTLVKLRTRNRLPSHHDWSPSELHLRNYLIALDGSSRGASYRQIAQVIYGPDRVRDAWTGESRFLKDQVRRAVERGHALMNGEYLKLLR
jgi:hypothetical protein